MQMPNIRQVPGRPIAMTQRAPLLSLHFSPLMPLPLFNGSPGYLPRKKLELKMLVGVF